MKLVRDINGLEVKVGDKVVNPDGKATIISYIEKPHKPAASGRVETGLGFHYVSVYGLEWIEREDR